MRFAAKIKAETGWKVVLATIEGAHHFFDVIEWGIKFGEPDMIPLIDNFKDIDIRLQKNFLLLMNPNVEYDFNKIKQMALEYSKHNHNDFGSRLA